MKTNYQVQKIGKNYYAFDHKKMETVGQKYETYNDALNAVKKLQRS